MLGLPGRAEAAVIAVASMMTVTIAAMVAVAVAAMLMARLMAVVVPVIRVVAADLHQRPGVDPRRGVAAACHQQDDGQPQGRGGASPAPRHAHPQQRPFLAWPGGQNPPPWR